MATYSEVYQSSRLQETPIPGTVSKQVSRSFADDRQVRVVDLGSGVGQVAVPLDRRGFEMVCLDADRRALDILRGKEPSIPSVQADIEEGVPFGSASFDVAVFSHVLHWLDRPARALAKIHRVLRAGGLLLSFLYAPEDVPDRIKNRLGGRRLAEVHRELVPTIPEIRSGLEMAGFRDIEVTKIPYVRSYETDDVRRVLDEIATRPLQEFRDRYGPDEYAALRDRIDRGLDEIGSGSTVTEREIECCIRAEKGAGDASNVAAGTDRGSA